MTSNNDDQQQQTTPPAGTPENQAPVPEQRYFGPGTGPEVDPTPWSGPTGPWSGPTGQPAPAPRRSHAVLITGIVCATLVVIALIAGITYAVSSGDNATPTTAAASTTTAAPAAGTKSAADRKTCVEFADAAASISTDPAINANFNPTSTAPADRAAATAWADAMRKIMDRFESGIAPGTSPAIDTATRRWISLQRTRADKIAAATLTQGDQATVNTQADLVRAVCA